MPHHRPSPHILRRHATMAPRATSDHVLHEMHQVRHVGRCGLRDGLAGAAEKLADVSAAVRGVVAWG